MNSVDLSLIEAMFFTAMQAGYAVEGISKAKVIDLPGYKEIRYEEPDLLLVDRWCVNLNSEKSAGTTTIWYQDNPVWFMSYGGHYPQSAIRLLKQALRMQYCQDVRFHGGRGPRVVADRGAGLIYMNRPEVNNFSEFKGREEIFSIDRGWIGYHDYWGMSLL
ncbi:MAG TPA: DUF5680 domain-containing protein [Candidatus Paceibacterota bacterium]